MNEREAFEKWYGSWTKMPQPPSHRAAARVAWETAWQEAAAELAALKRVREAAYNYRKAVSKSGLRMIGGEEYAAAEEIDEALNATRDKP
jgi:hypothetical protein